MSQPPEAVPVSVVIPTIGRLEPLRRCLESLARSATPPAEILVVDQSHDPAIEAAVVELAGDRGRVVPSDGVGVARARNDGLRAAAHDVVLVTDDDCTVPPDWVSTGARLAAAHPGAIVTGKVLPVGDPRAVPSTKDDPSPRDLSGERRGGWLFGNNMVLPRIAVLELGGFDERFGPEEAAEDNEFCYRWLKTRHGLRYEPALVVDHHDWRSPDDLERLYVRYARGEGFFYGMHLRRGDLRMLRFVARDLVWAARGIASGVVKRRQSWTDSRRGILRGMPGGLVAGWRAYGKER
jgi:glycosyltransferase involved in cell wall biosynthesis